MKKALAPFFGNRFASAARKARTSKSARNAAPVATTEMETLESRILLSGIGTGLNKKSVNFVDADGDKVTVKITGRGATFDIDLGGATNNADVANITINGNGSLSVVVTPVGSLTRPVINWSKFNPGAIDGKFNEDAGLIYQVTPGYTNIGSITVAPGVTQVGSIGLTAAVVADIDLGTATAGNISLNIGKVAGVDAVMGRNPGGYDAGLGSIDFFDITAGKITGINLSGSVTGANDFLGDISVVNGITRITAPNSEIFGQISIDGKAATLGNIVVAGWGASSGISATGDLTFNAVDFNGVLNVEGHLSLGITGGDFGGTIIANGGISGLRTGTLDPIYVTGALVQGQILAPGAGIADIFFTNSEMTLSTIRAETIGDITFGNSTFNTTTIEADSIGVITAFNTSIDAGNSILADDLEAIRLYHSNFFDGSVVVVQNTLATVHLTNGGFFGEISAGNIGAFTIEEGDFGGIAKTTSGDFDALSITFGDFFGTISSADGIGSVLVTGGQIEGNIIATGAGGIGTIRVDNLRGGEGGQAIRGGAVIFSGGDIDSIIATTVGGIAIEEASITALGVIGNLQAISYADNGFGSGGLFGVQFVAGSFGVIDIHSIGGTAIQETSFTSTAGGIGGITATGRTGGIVESKVISAAGIGPIVGTAFVEGFGISLSQFDANDGDIASITGATNDATFFSSGLEGVVASASGGIGPISGKAFAGTGISGGQYTAIMGDIGAVTGTSTGINDFGDGITAAIFTAAAGKIGDISGTAAGSGEGLDSVNALGQLGIGVISASSFRGDGIVAGQYTAVSGDIEGIKATTSTGTAISAGASFEAVGGKIQFITATPTGVGGNAINTAFFTATSFGPLNFEVTNLAGGFVAQNAFFTATDGGIDSITVTNASKAAGAFGISASNFFATGGIGPISVETVGNGVEFSTFFADSDGDFNGDIGEIVVAVSGVGSTAINLSSFVGTNIANGIEEEINVFATNFNSGDAIQNSVFQASKGSIGDIVVGAAGFASTAISDGSVFIAIGGDIGEVSVGSVADPVGGIGIANSIFQSDGNIGRIFVHADDLAIENAGFIADSDASGAGDIASVFARTVNGSAAIIDAQFFGENIGLVNDPVSGVGFFVENANATGSNAIFDTGFFFVSAANDLGSVTISNAALFGALDLSSGGSLSAGNNAGAFTVLNTNKAAFGNAILGDGSGVAQIVVGNNLQSLTVTNNALGAGANGLDDVKIDVIGTLGAVNITADGGAGMVNSSIDPVSIESVTIVGGNGAAIDATSEIIAAGAPGSIGPIVLTGDMDGFIGAETIESLTIVDGDLNGTVSVAGDFALDIEIAVGDFTGTIIGKNILGDITVLFGDFLGSVIATEDIVGDITVAFGDFDGLLDAGSDILGDITIGGNALLGSTITAVESIADVTITGDFDAVVEAGTSIGKFFVGGSVLVNGEVLAGTGGVTGGVAQVDVGGDYAGTVQSLAPLGDIGTVAIGGDILSFFAFDTAGKIGNIVVGGDIVAAYFVGGISIGDITVLGEGNHALVLSSNGTIGNVAFTGLADLNGVILRILDAIEIGDITVTSPGGTADLDFDRGGTLTSMGNLTVDGNLHLVFGFAGADLTNLDTLAGINVGSFSKNTDGAAIFIGSGNVGSTAGQILIGDPNGGVHPYIFNFDSFTGVPNAIIDATPVNSGDTFGGYELV